MVKRVVGKHFVCFVNDQRVAGEGVSRIVEASHALSSRESYLGLQEALRKIRYHEGTRCPGAWAGACVVVEEGIGVAVQVLQERWDRMKEICKYWLQLVKAGHTTLDYKRLQSDQGFMVYVTQAYSSLKPYLKGFHLLLEKWCGGHNTEGWRLRGCLVGTSNAQTGVNAKIQTRKRARQWRRSWP
jgi:hypothetical protein